MVALCCSGVVHPLFEIDATVASEVIEQLAGFMFSASRRASDGETRIRRGTLAVIRLVSCAVSDVSFWRPS